MNAREFWLLAAAMVAILWGAVAIGLPFRHVLRAASIGPEQGQAYVARLELPWPLVIPHDDLGTPPRSTVVLTEDGRELGPGHAGHKAIRERGGGRYSHWQGTLYFSSSDGSDPRINGRRYVAWGRVQLAAGAPLVSLAGLAAGAAWLLAWGRSRQRLEAGALLRLAAWWLGAAGLFVAAGAARQVPFWVLAGLAGAAAVRAAALMGDALGVCLGGERRDATRGARGALLALSLGLALAAGELVLALSKGGASPSSVAALSARLESFGVQVPEEVLARALRRQAAVALGPDLARQSVEVSGAAWAYRWQGALHVFDRSGMRRTAPWPPKRPQVPRIAVLGDSFTYGDGVAEEWTYPRQLERLLSAEGPLEVLNLGVDGHQSEDVVGTAEDLLPELAPDLVIYGVCLNDFLPSGVAVRGNPRALALPVPATLSALLARNSRLASLAAGAWDGWLRRAGLRPEFYRDIESGFPADAERFGRDMERLRRLLAERGRPAALALVLEQRPVRDGPGHRLARVAERRLREAGLDVVPTEAYFRHFDGADFTVSRWERHPNEVAHAIWAEMLAGHLRRRARGPVAIAPGREGGADG